MPKTKSMIADLKATRAFGKGDYREVIRLLEDSVETHGDESTAIWKIAYSYMQLGEYDSAIEWGSRGLVIEPRDMELLQLLAGCFSHQGDHDRAYQCICRALEQPPRKSMELGRFMRGLLGFLSLHPRLRRVAPDRVQRGLKKVDQDHSDWRLRAAEYKTWYETTHRKERS